ncbi:hypothetical protein [Rhodoplanes sp. Z2-YC6860]|uniref:hypothetical protein n=1 Tax=Rhodoplanes sp. Z2-YC6860 TaxID=674703 RepID=UPI0012EE32DE|nr:hypothetical protein [Rhodoplanes sp. Z2-YC6860]
MVVIDKRTVKPERLPPTANEVEERLVRLARMKKERAEDAPKATQEYRAAEAAARSNIKRLRAERLARTKKPEH